MQRYFSFFLFILPLSVFAQQSTDPAEIANDHATGEIAYEVTEYVQQFWRLAGNPGFDSSIWHVVSKLEAAGFVPEGSSNQDALTYRIERRPLAHPAWHPVNAEVRLADTNELLLKFEDNMNMISVNSHATPPTGITAPVVLINDLEELPGKDVKDNIVYSEIHPYYLFNAAVLEFGAAGIMTYGMPSYLQPEVNRKSIQFNSIPYSDTLDAWSVALSYEANERLKKYLENGNSEVSVSIETDFIEAEELTIVAQIKGNRYPDDEVVVSAHVQEPGANDNASGVGAATEMAAILAKLVNEGSYTPLRTITLLWGDEIISTRRYVEEYKDKIKWGFSLDMVGENTSVTGGTFLIEKMPDPSAIWTRGNDKHTEWGGSPISKDQLQPHYLNEFVTARMMDQGKRNDWVVNTNPYEGGSDHVPFLRNQIPAVLFWHFTDQFYHTDQDRIDKVSKETLRNVVAGTLSSVMTLASGEEALALSILDEINLAARERINTEALLSLNAIENGENRKYQRDIITTWVDYYRDVVETVTDLASSDTVKEAITRTKESISEYGLNALDSI